MPNHPNAPRDRFVNTRWSDAEHQDLVKRAREARAKTPSAYIRAAALTGREFEVPSYATLRELINSMIETTAALTASPPGPARDRALEAAIAALDRVVSR